MKTVFDVASFLKRNPNKELYLSFNPATSRFEVLFTLNHKTESAALDSALDNLVEEMRRAGSSPIAPPPRSTCPKCNSLPITYVYGNIGRLQCSQCVEQWPAPVKQHVKFANVKSAFVFDGSNWSSVQP